MSYHELPEEERRLLARLTVEAADERPEFSQTLHDRIMQSVREASPIVVRHARRRTILRRWVAGSAAAVALLLAVWLVRGVDRHSTAEAPVPHADGPLIPDPGIAAPHDDQRETALTAVVPPAADRLTALVDATFSGSQWAYLDHDAQLAASMVLDHLPFELPVAEVP